MSQVQAVANYSLQHLGMLRLLRPVQLEKQILPHPANGANMSGSFK